ncbi:MAG: iron-sulfur cluster insertion protein ErpA [Alphaproteobacteria bacterium]|nr:iron-sulfur cluster insertion protein ErpA [Alphaproteobacteria bacterium]
MSNELQISDSAAKRISEMLAKEKLNHGAFRVAVEGGGCSGFQYKFAIEDNPSGENDIVISKNGASVVVDEMSLELLKGSQIDFVETLAGAAFEINNPNSTASCGCGNSFSVI